MMATRAAALSPRRDSSRLPATASALLPPDAHHLPAAPGSSFTPEPGQHPPGGWPHRGRRASELCVEPNGGHDPAGCGRGVARLEPGGHVFGEGGVIERATIEPVLQAAEPTLVGAPGIRADRNGGKLAARSGWDEESGPAPCITDWPFLPTRKRRDARETGHLCDQRLLAPLECHGRSRQCHSRTGLRARPVRLGLQQ